MHVIMLPPSITPTQCMWSCFHLAYHLHNARDHASTWHTTYTMHVIMLPPGIPPTQCPWSCFHLAYHLHNARDHASTWHTTYTMHVIMLPPGIPPTQCTWSCFHLAYHLHNACDHASTWHTTYTMQVIMLPPGIPPTQCMWSCFHLAYHLHNAWSHFLLAYHPHNLYSISAENNCILFTWVTRSISYFCFQCPASTVSSIHQQMSKELFNSILWVKILKNTWHIRLFFSFTKIYFLFYQVVSYHFIVKWIYYTLSFLYQRYRCSIAI